MQYIPKERGVTVDPPGVFYAAVYFIDMHLSLTNNTQQTSTTCLHFKTQFLSLSLMACLPALIVCLRAIITDLIKIYFFF